MNKPKIYIRNRNGILDGIIKSEEFERVDNPSDADCLVLWQDVRGELAELAKINRKHLHKPLVVVQHGAGGSRDYGHPVNFEFMSDKFCCWGTSDYDRLVKFGHKDKAVITGCPITNQFKPKKVEDDKNIVFCPVATEHEEPSNLIVFYELKRLEMKYSQKNIMDHRKELEKGWKPTTFNLDNKLAESNIPYLDISKNFRLVAKLLPSHDKALYLGSACVSSVHSPTHVEDCVKLLSHTSVVVGMLESTFVLQAMAMDVPVVICEEYEFKTYGDHEYTNWDHIKTEGATYCKLGDLTRVVEGEVANPGRLAKERKAVALREFGDTNSDPDKKITEVIKELINGGK